jgi:hypothetical protein
MVHNSGETAAAGAYPFGAVSAIFGARDSAATIREMRARLAGARAAAG